MQRHAGSAVAAAMLVAIGCASSSATTTERAPAVACPKGSLHTVYRGTHRCLGLAARRRVHDGLARARDRGASGERAYRVTGTRFRVGVRTVVAIAQEGARKGWALPPAPRLPRGVPVLGPGGARAASRLTARPDCVDAEPGRGVVHLSWRRAGEPGSEQRVIVTIFADGFERPAFEASGPLAGGRAALEWYRARGEAIHFWKVLTRHPDGWVPTATGRFTGPGCPLDLGP